MKTIIYPLLGKVIMFTELIGLPLIFAVPILLIFKKDNIAELVGSAAVLNIFIYAIWSMSRGKYTTDHLKNNICPNCKSHELSFSEGGASSGHEYDIWECRICGYGWEHAIPKYNYYNRYVRKENKRYKRF